MGFELVERNRHVGRNSNAAPALISIGKEGKHLKLRFSFLEATATSLGWKEGEPIEVRLGTGVDSGTVKLAPGPRGFILGRSTPKARRLQVRCAAPDGYGPHPWTAPDVLRPQSGTGSAPASVVIKLPFEKDVADGR